MLAVRSTALCDALCSGCTIRVVRSHVLDWNDKTLDTKHENVIKILFAENGATERTGYSSGVCLCVRSPAPYHHPFQVMSQLFMVMILLPGMRNISLNGVLETVRFGWCFGGFDSESRFFNLF